MAAECLPKSFSAVFAVIMKKNMKSNSNGRITIPAYSFKSLVRRLRKSLLALGFFILDLPVCSDGVFIEASTSHAYCKQNGIRLQTAL
jgi:hypothetical protein